MIQRSDKNLNLEKIYNLLIFPQIRWADSAAITWDNMDAVVLIAAFGTKVWDDDKLLEDALSPLFFVFFFCWKHVKYFFL